MIVLGASALLAYLFRESGHQVVAEYFESACISTVNLSELAGRFIRDGIDHSPLTQQIGASKVGLRKGATQC
jgi:PIN domain nuclease of toxin-antitoxin system